ncbi:Hint domain-containing protein [Oceaniglobus ichthyenteri]|uniref:Hint domain-containing protein n=1 Tax=Oceaniglobus ichthyenteri TaxID=2136177 RepID=UPI0013DDEB81|nr:Hint domain-containing protein [Oceaniglobus ichthyenteri]
MIGASEVSVTGGVTLDGITQGDGSHLVGQEITFDSRAWNPVSISDNGWDRKFSDNDCSQRLDGAQSVDGRVYSDGTKVEAEYSIVLTDGADTWTAVAFNVNNSDPAYGTIEGLAIVGAPGTFPPPGVALTVVSAEDYPSFHESKFVTPICFATGTRIGVRGGTRAVEDLRTGDLVRVRGGMAERVLWCGARMFRATAETAPIRFAPGVLDNNAPLVVSPQHRILVTTPMADLLFCSPGVLIPAKAFVNGTTVTQPLGGLIRYHHLLFAHHQIVFSNGVPSESFLPGRASLATLTAQARAEVMALFPALRDNPDAYGPAAAPTLRPYEAQAILAA